ncbi:MAG: PAS domain-containing protein [Burkholderiaceae bacterium]|nr:PAS domain-containing protein [Rhodoferax sp.]MCP5287352.1 PAS domain-containing protein [Burkholderiaceae bacterium]
MSAEAPTPQAPPEASTLFDLLPVGAYRSTPDGRMLRANPALVKLNGYTTEAELISAVHDIAGEWYVDPAQREQFRRQLATEGRVIGLVSEVYRHRTRERIWISENAHQVRDDQGNLLCYEGTVEEITDRIRTQQALERSDAQLRLIARRVPGVVYLAHVSPQGLIRFLFISEGVRDVYGVDPEEAQRDGHVLQRMRHPVDDVRVQNGLTQSERAGTAHDAEFRILHRDGSVRWVQATSTPIHHDADGDHRCGLIVDVTARHEADALRLARDRAETAHHAIAGLLARISHELRTPMNAMLGFTQLLQADPSLSSRHRQFADESLRAGRHLLALVDDLLELGRAESGDITLQLSALDPAVALAESLALLAPLLQAQAVTVTRPDSPLPRLRADPLRLRQVLTNLLSNAIKYNRVGGWVAVAARRTGATVAVTVSDGGPGLNAAQQARLFQPFERLGAERGPVHGTGLGLALSQQLAHAMGGDITAACTPGQGCQFTLSLPAAD